MLGGKKYSFFPQTLVYGPTNHGWKTTKKNRLQAKRRGNEECDNDPIKWPPRWLS